MKAETLCRIIADDLGVDAANVRIGNGSSELLQMACYAFGGAGHKIAYPYPSFSMYGVYAQLADSQGVPFPLDVNGYVDADAV
jgi:histidinol-phosphate aminotransferase